MTREAALLGTPTVSVFAGRRSAVDESLAVTGRMRIARDLTDIVPVRRRTTATATPKELRSRATLLVGRFVEVIEEAAQVPPSDAPSIRFRRSAWR